MAASNALIGFGADLLQGDGGSPTETFTTLGVEIMSITPPGMSRDSIDVTHMSSPNTAREFIAGLIDSGEFTIEFNFIPATSDAVFTALQAARGNWQILLANSIAWTFAAFCTGYTPAVPLDDKMTASATFKVSGLPTLSDES